MDDVSRDLGDFLRYLSSGAAESDFTKRLDTQVESAKMKEQWRLEYMTLYMRDKDIFEDGKAEGLAEGRAEGKAEGKAEAVLSMFLKGRITAEEAAEEMDITVDEFQILLSDKNLPD